MPRIRSPYSKTYKILYLKYKFPHFTERKIGVILGCSGPYVHKILANHFRAEDPVFKFMLKSMWKPEYKWINVDVEPEKEQKLVRVGKGGPEYWRSLASKVRGWLFDTGYGYCQGCADLDEPPVHTLEDMEVRFEGKVYPTQCARCRDYRAEMKANKGEERRRVRKNEMRKVLELYQKGRIGMEGD